MSLDAVPRAALTAPRSEEDLEERLSRPTPWVVEALRTAPGDIVVLGAGGKMGPSLTLMARRAADAVGDARRVIAVSRWSNPAEHDRLLAAGVEVVQADLGRSTAVAELPRVPNVIFMAGQKFGTTEAPWHTWMTNTVLPARVADHYQRSRVVAFSTGNVYPLSRAAGSGSREDDPLQPVGEYAATCLGRERVLEHAAAAWGTPISIVRLNYAVDLRYGVLVDIARRVLADEPVDLTMGFVNCIWQGDANAVALATLPLAAAPPFVLNLTGPEKLSVRAIALEVGRLVGREPRFVGIEGSEALLSDTARMQAYFGAPTVSAHTLIAWVSEWLQQGGRTLGKPTRFERRDGAF